MNNDKVRFDVIKYTNKFLIFSAILMIISIGSFIFRGLNFGIDFQGGTIITIKLDKQFEVSDIKKIMEKYDNTAEITTAGEDETQVVISSREDMDEGVRQSLVEDFMEKYEIKNKKSISIENVSASMGGELKDQAILASIIAILCILIYVSFRFEFLFGISAIASLAHDVIIVIGIFSIFQIQVNGSFIAALLTILGYSINDTIVIFDRIRENRRWFGKYEYGPLINTSINQTMKRSIFTTLTTLICVVPLFVLGTTSIREFILPMIIGFISGVYSSVFVAGALWYKIKQSQLAKSEQKKNPNAPAMTYEERKELETAKLEAQGKEVKELTDEELQARREKKKQKKKGGGKRKSTPKKKKK